MSRLKLNSTTRRHRRWITPFGPFVWGVPFLSFFFVGLFFALLITALIPSGGSSKKSINRQNMRAERDAMTAVDAFLWILLFGLIISIIAAYIRG